MVMSYAKINQVRHSQDTIAEAYVLEAAAGVTQDP